jgi:hypothetical protein
MRTRAVRIRKWVQIGMGLMMAGTLGACATTVQGARQSPEATVTGFYAWYEGFEGSPLGGRAYRDSDYLSPAFIRQLDALVDSFKDAGGGFDPFICAQDRPSEVKVMEVEESGDRARVTVEAWAPIQVDVAREGTEWQITDIHCTPPRTPLQ